MATPNSTTKRCSTCGVEKPRTNEFFPRLKKAKDGLHSHCKTCHSAKECERYKNDPVTRERQIDYSRQYRHEHKDDPVFKQKEHERSVAKWNNPKTRRYFQDYQRRRFSTEAGRKTYRVYVSKRHARVRNALGRYSEAELTLQIKAQTDKKGKVRCWICGKVIVGKFHIDHWIPLIEGGSNAADNIRITHPSCNLKKNDKLPSKLGRLL